MVGDILPDLGAALIVPEDAVRDTVKNGSALPVEFGGA
jgi:hypothetical protein